MCDINDLRSILNETQDSNRARRRAIGFSIRLVLEEELDRLWEVAFIDINKENRYTDNQFICLKQLVNPVIAGGIHFAWATLSKVCHYQEYELTPTIPELKILINHVGQLLEDLRTLHDNGTVEK